MSFRNTPIAQVSVLNLSQIIETNGSHLAPWGGGRGDREEGGE
jgi:hypothetical protein